MWVEWFARIWWEASVGEEGRLLVMKPKLELVGYDMEVGALVMEGGWWDNQWWERWWICSVFFLIWFNCFFIKKVEGRDMRKGWFG